MSADPFRDPAALIERLYAYVALRVGDGPEAEEVTSRALERAVRYRDSYDPRLGSPLMWLIGIARRCAREPSGATAIGLDLDGRAATGSVEDEAIARVLVSELVPGLRPREREVIALRFGADLAHKEIATLLGTSPGAVRVALHRALEHLRRLADEPPAADPRLPSSEPRLSEAGRV